MCESLIEDYQYPHIQPRTKAQRKQYENLRDKLKISCQQEDFVLKSILSFDWNRTIIIQQIVHVRKSKSLDMVDFKVYVTAPSHTVNYCCSNPFKDKGWSDDCNSFSKRSDYVYTNLRRYLH